MNLRAIVDEILDQYVLPIDGDHGVGHWARSLENGLRLARSTGASVEVVQLFAVFHDACRINEVGDTGHGERGAALAKRLRGKLFDLSDEDFHRLFRACADHTGTRDHPDPTVRTCWDADRLDLGRVGIKPHASRLCTAAAKRPEMIKWADGRACFRVVPPLVAEDWGISLP